MRRVITPITALTLITAIILAITFFKPMPSHAASAPHLFSSKNYAGYVNRSSGSHATKFTSVAGSWQVPSVKCSKANQAVGIWIGIGGIAHSNDLEQDGILIVCNASPHPQYVAFFEILPAAAQILTLPVRPGDRINASVNFIGGSVFNFQIQDTTQGWNFARRGNKSGARLGAADCVVEAPSTLSNHILSLAKFSTVTISGCLANGSPINAGPFLMEIVLTSADTRDIKAQPSGLFANGTAFTVTWEHN